MYVRHGVRAAEVGTRTGGQKLTARSGCGTSEADDEGEGFTFNLPFGNMFGKFLSNCCSKEEPSLPRNLCGHGHGRVQTSDGNCAMVTRRGSGFLFPSILEGGEMGELALTAAQMATNLHATRRS